MVIALPYLHKSSLQILTRINRKMENKLQYFNIPFFFPLTFLHLKTEFHCSFVLALPTNFIVVAAMLPVIRKLNVILGSECVSTWEFLHSPRKEFMVMMILPWKNMIVLQSLTSIWRFLNSHYQQQQQQLNGVTLMECPLINRDHPLLNKNKQSLRLERFDS